MESNEEIWKKYGDYYEVSNFGRIKSLYRNKITILKTVKKSYEIVNLQINKISKNMSVHRLVALSFLDKPADDKIVVNHKDGNKLNNRIENLEWVTSSENSKHKIDTKLHIPKTMRVSMYLKDRTTFVATFDSVKDAMKASGCSDSKICMVCKGKRNHTGGFFWKYTDIEYEETKEPEGGTLDNYPNYIITKDGQVYSKSHKKFLSTRLNLCYVYVTLYNSSKKDQTKDFSLHYLVAKVFIPNPNNYPVVNHKNYIKDDNRLENLEWVTYSENSIHSNLRNT